MVNYKLGKIYKIVRNSDDVVIYVGSTCETALCRRLAKHKSMSRTKPNRKIYRTIAENGDWNNHEIILIENCNCNSRDELHRKEREFIDYLKPQSNKQVPMRTTEEYTKYYYYKNYEIIQERATKIEKCKCGTTYTYSHKQEHCRTNKHKNNITVQFEQITKMHNELKKRPPIPDLSNLLLV